MANVKVPIRASRLPMKSMSEVVVRDRDGEGVRHRDLDVSGFVPEDLHPDCCPYSSSSR